METVQIKPHPVLGILVSSRGEVYIHAGHSKKFHWTPGSDIHGYMRVKLGGKAYLVHRLVAETFLENPENFKTVDHIDRNPSNNTVSNLRWADQHMQMRNTSAYDRTMEKYGIHSCDDRAEWQRRYRNTPEGRARIKRYYAAAKQTNSAEVLCV